MTLSSLLSKTPFLIFMVSGFTSSVLAEPRNDGYTNKIINGENAGFDEFPYFAYFYDCGGTLIAEDIVLTAAHCRNGKSFKKSGIQVTINSYYQYEIRGEAQERFCTEWVDHPDYDDWNVTDDYALCKLDKPVVIDESKVRLELNEDNSTPFDGEELLTIGLGYSTTDYQEPSILQKVNVPVTSNDECKKIPGYRSVDENMICVAGEVGGKDTCYGDSGSPMVRRTQQEDGTFVDTHIGLNSWGRYDGIACGYKNPGASVFARTSTRLDWIKETACILGSQASWCNNPPPGSCNGPKVTFELRLPEGVTFEWWRSDPKVKWSLWDTYENRYINFSKLKRVIVDKEYLYTHTMCLEFDTEYDWNISMETPLEYSLHLDDELLLSGSDSKKKSFSLASCMINPNPFYTSRGKERNCSEIAGLSTGRKQLCGKGAFSKNCSGLCNTEACPCKNYPDPFPWKNGSLSCSEVAGLSAQQQQRKCRKRIIAKNCPAVCKKECSSNASSQRRALLEE